MLAGAALAEALARGAVHHRNGSSGVLLTSAFLALCATAPLGFLGAIGAATAVVAASVLAMTITGVLPAGSAVAVVVAMYRLGWAAGSFAESRLRRLAATFAVALSVPFPVIALCVPRHSDAGVVAVLLSALAPAAAFAGNAAHARTEARVHQAAREAVARSLVEHTARGERARIARELHDVVAHHISMIAVQAETGRLTTPGLPAAGAQRFAAIGDTARAGLTEMRRLLGVLREDAEQDTASEPAAQPARPGDDRRPQPGLPQLGNLVDDAREASGGAVRLIMSGQADRLDPGVELAAYRIVQEALTNARRHAPGAAVDVELCYAEDWLWLRIRDNGPGHQARSHTGHGLLGMRERAAAVGGALQAGDARGGGFCVEAELPAKAPDAMTGAAGRMHQ